MVPASALMLFSPTVAPASPCRVPREVREFMAAPAVELGVEAATARQKADKGRGEKDTVSESRLAQEAVCPVLADRAGGPSVTGRPGASLRL